MRIWAAIAIAMLATPASARDLGQWSQVSPERRACFHDLRSPDGGMCCDGADGIKIEDPNWHDNGDGSFTVRIDGEDQVIKPGFQTNASKCGADYAIAWTYLEWDHNKQHHKVRCFSPGTRS